MHAYPHAHIQTHFVNTLTHTYIHAH